MSKAAVELVRELSARMGEYYELHPTAADTTTTIVDPSFLDIKPHAVGGGNSFWNAWVYAATDADALNIGLDRRARAWDGTNTATFYTAWPVAPSTGTYEVHERIRRNRKLAAINASADDLNIWWKRQVKNEITLTQMNQWKYIIDPSEHWESIERVEVQMSVDPTLQGYPYADMMPWNYSARSWEDPTTGDLTWELQFEALPPSQPNRIVRIWGWAFYADLVNDADILPMGSAWEGLAMEYLYETAMAKLFLWEASNVPSNQTERYDKKWASLMAERRQDIIDRYRPRKGNRIIVPGRGDGLFNPPGGAGSRWEYLGAYRSGAFN